MRPPIPTMVGIGAPVESGVKSPYPRTPGAFAGSHRAMHRRSLLRVFHRAFAVLGLLLVVQTGLAAQLCLAVLGSAPAAPAAPAVDGALDVHAAPCCSHASEPVDCLASPYNLEPGTPKESPLASFVAPALAALWAPHASPEPRIGSPPPLASPYPEVPIPIRLHRYFS